MTGSVLRAVAFTGLAASSAAVAHGGPAAASDPRWMAAALAGAALAGLVLWQGWRLLLAGGQACAQAPLSALIPAMLLAQLAAHAGLLAAGAPAHTGAGSLALHLCLAAIAAVLVKRIEAGVAGRVLAARQAPPETAPPAPRPAPAAVPRGTALCGHRGRAPPLLV